MPNAVLRLVIAMVVGGVLAGIVGFVIGIPVLRLRGDYLAIVTLAFGEIMKNIYRQPLRGRGRHAVCTLHPHDRGPEPTGRGRQDDSSPVPMGATGITKLSTFAHRLRAWCCSPCSWC